MFTQVSLRVDATRCQNPSLNWGLDEAVKLIKQLLHFMISQNYEIQLSSQCVAQHKHLILQNSTSQTKLPLRMHTLFAGNHRPPTLVQ